MEKEIDFIHNCLTSARKLKKVKQEVISGIKLVVDASYSSIDSLLQEHKYLKDTEWEIIGVPGYSSGYSFKSDGVFIKPSKKEDDNPRIKFICDLLKELSDDKEIVFAFPSLGTHNTAHLTYKYVNFNNYLLDDVVLTFKVHKLDYLPFLAKAFGIKISCDNEVMSRDFKLYNPRLYKDICGDQ